MTHAPTPAPAPQPRPRIGPGLKLRLWLACLSGGLVAAAGTLWMLATPSLSPSDPAVYGWLAGVACASLIIGLLLALWIDHHVVGQLHGLLLGLRSNRVAELRGLPAGTGWGELSELADAVQDVLERRQHEGQALRACRRAAMAHDAVERHAHLPVGERAHRGDEHAGHDPQPHAECGGAARGEARGQGAERGRGVRVHTGHGRRGL